LSVMHASAVSRRRAPRASATWPFSLAALALFAVLMLGSLTRTHAVPNAAQVEGEADSYTKLLSFVPNRGQLDRDDVRYYAHGSGFAFHFTNDRVAIALTKGERGHALHLRFLGASEDAKVVAGERRRGNVNYLAASERRTNIPTYGTVTYRDLWPGIDMAISGSGGGLKYEFRLAPGADPTDIRLAYAGASGLSVTDSGALAVATPLGPLADTRPRTYQRAGGRRVPVASSFALQGGRSYGFSLGAYDQGRPLVIDPGLAYSTFLGGSGNEDGQSIAVDRAGSAYVVGDIGTNDPSNFPTTPGAFQPGGLAGQLSFVTKLSPDGSELVYSTLIPAAPTADGVAVDDQGNAYVTGGTSRTDFPTTPGAFDRTRAGTADRYVLKLNSTGSALIYSTYLGGSGRETLDFHHGDKRIAVDEFGQAYVTAYTDSSDFPTTPGAHDRVLGGSQDAFVSKLNADGSDLVYSTYLGGAGLESNAVIAVDRSGGAHVAGTTDSADLATAGASDTTYGGGSDSFVARLTNDGSALAYATYIGGSSGDSGKGIALDNEGSAYITGSTGSSDFPTTPGSHDTSRGGGADAFVTKVSPDGASLAYSTLVGGTRTEQAESIAVNPRGEAHITGYTGSPDFPTTPDAIDSTLAGPLPTTQQQFFDGFFTKLDPPGSAVAYSTFLGDTHHDRAFGVATVGGRAYVTGETGSTEFPTTPGAFDESFNGILDAFVMRFDLGFGPPARLDLTPESATNVIGSEHCVTASVRDEVGDPTPNEVVRFSVTGAVEASSAATTDADGQARFCYAGPELAGADQITAFADTNSDGDPDAGEPGGVAEKNWVLPVSTPRCRAWSNGRIRAANGDLATFRGKVNSSESGAPRGTETYLDRGPAARVDMRSSSIDALVCDRPTATVFGRGRVNGDEVGFRIDLEDGPGRADSYRIVLATGYDSGTQRLIAGHVKVR
jgi:hypothetical protein